MHLRVSLMQLVMQLVHLLFGTRQRASAGGRDPIHAPAASIGIRKGFDQPRALQAVKQWIESPRPDAISMAPQLLHHGQAEYGFVCRMHQNVDSD